MGGGAAVLQQEMVIKCENISNDLLRFVLSEYKLELWNLRNRIKFDNEPLNLNICTRNLEGRVRLFIRHLSK